MAPSPVPESRLRRANSAPENPHGAYVLYWMIAARRTRWSFALDHARAEAEARGKPLLVFEALRCGHRWASPRIHRFVLDGMADNQARCAEHGVPYLPYVEPSPGAGKGLLEALAARACLVVTDDFPCFFLPRMVAAAAARSPVRLDAVDSNGVVPLAATPKAFGRAFDFRRWFQKQGFPSLDLRPAAEPLEGMTRVERDALLPPGLLERWPEASSALLSGSDPRLLAELPLDHEVPPLAQRGGPSAGEERMQRFLSNGLRRYDERNHPDRDAGSGLSPYLHFGHVSAHEFAGTLLDDAGWTAASPPLPSQGKREGWWGLDAQRESFLDELITWREVGYTFCHHTPDHAEFGSLPGWARTTMDEHRGDRRPETYSLQQLEAAQTGDALWNAGQRQLRAEGVIHNYLRMLWGKRIYEWSATPEQAWERLEHLNNRWSIDGRDPNSYSGIGWVLGRFDRAWGPERHIFGKLRYMTSDSARRKLQLNDYLERWGPQRRLF